MGLVIVGKSGLAGNSTSCDVEVKEVVWQPSKSHTEPAMRIRSKKTCRYGVFSMRGEWLGPHYVNSMTQDEGMAIASQLTRGQSIGVSLSAFPEEYRKYAMSLLEEGNPVLLQSKNGLVQSVADAETSGMPVWVWVALGIGGISLVLLIIKMLKK